MKSFLLSILILTSSYVVCQTEKAIVNENCNWSTLEVHCMPNGNNYSTYFVKFEGDTIIDGYVYKKSGGAMRKVKSIGDFMDLFGKMRIKGSF